MFLSFNTDMLTLQELKQLHSMLEYTLNSIELEELDKEIDNFVFADE